MPSTLGDTVFNIPPTSPNIESSPSLPLHDLSKQRRRTDNRQTVARDVEEGPDSWDVDDEGQGSSGSSSTGPQISHFRGTYGAQAGHLASVETQRLVLPDDFEEKAHAYDGRGRNPGMGKRHTSRSSTPASVASATSADNTRGSANGNGLMNGSFEMRRKHVGADSTQQTTLLMAGENFSLDDEPPPPTPVSSGHDTGFFDLPKHDQRSFLLLILLYFLQGVPMGLAGGSIPFLLKSHLSYGQIGVYSLVMYPYSLKLLWSPIVDAIWSPLIGRRKSWILPIQTCSGFGLLYLGSRAMSMMVEAEKEDGSGVWVFTAWWFGVVFMCATQDIAVDGWALTLLSPQNLSYASTAQTIGLTAGQFMSFTIFLAFNAKEFANRYLRTKPLDVGIITLGGYLTFWGWTYLLVTLGLAFLKREEKTKTRDGVVQVYKDMLSVLKLPAVQSIVFIHLIGKIGFQANDAVTNLKLLDKGFSQEDLALTVLIDFPFEISLGYYAGRWSTVYPPVHIWCWGFMGRLMAAVVAQGVVMAFPAGGTTSWYLLAVIASHIFSTFTSTVMFVALNAFHARISDPVIGGTYMTLLAT